MKIIETTYCCEIIDSIKKEVAEHDSDAVDKDAFMYIMDRIKNHFISHSIDIEESK